jgi:hypothetical protein
MAFRQACMLLLCALFLCSAGELMWCQLAASVFKTLAVVLSDPQPDDPRLDFEHTGFSTTTSPQPQGPY